MRRKEYHNNIIAAAICDSVGLRYLYTCLVNLYNKP